jgi:high-affinity Fe2+/Pb2+ permease
MEWAGVLPLPAADSIRAATGVVLGAAVAWAIGLTVDAWLRADR